MAKETEIAWTDSTFNPWWGCQKVGPGCDHCYAETLDKRTGGNHWGPGAERRRTSIRNWNDPIRWNAKHEAFFALHGRRQRVFCASMADVFDNAVDPQWRADLFELILKTPNLDWLILTKRIGNVMGMMPRFADVHSNVWLGITIVNQEEADRDIPKLLAVPAHTRFLSMEPLLGYVDVFSSSTGELLHVSGDDCNPGGLDWVFAGGESGPGARPMHPEWARSLRDQCKAADVPFLFKQWGEWTPRGPESMGYELVEGVPCLRLTDSGENGSGLGAGGDNHCWMQRSGKKATGRLLDGVLYDGFPP